MNETQLRALVADLATLDVRLWADDGVLRFDAPKGALTEQHIAQLKQHKPELIRYLSKRQATEVVVPAIERLDADAHRPLSFSQERMWFLHEFQQDEQARATYNMTGAIRLRGALDVNALQRAFDQIIARHEALRTRFVTDQDGVLTLSLVEPHSLPLPHVDLRHKPAAEAEAEFRRQARADALHSFDLATEPLLRLRLFQMGPDHHVVLINMHHMVSDGWSLGVLIHELGAHYTAFVDGRPSAVRPLPIQYGDYAAWQRNWLNGEVLEQQLEFWQTHLTQVPAVLELPTDKPRPAIQSYRGALVELAIGSTTTKSLTALARKHRATPFMALLAVYGLLLHRYSGAQTLAIGVPVANRRPKTEGLIGLFMNTVVMPLTVQPEATFIDLLERVRDFSLESQAHQDVPFEQLVERLRPERNLSHTPLFQAMFIMQNTPSEALTMGSLDVEVFEIERVTAKFDLTLSLQEQDGGLTGWLEYNSDLFEQSTAEAMTEHFGQLLRSALASPERPMHELVYLTDAQLRAALSCRGTAIPLPSSGGIAELFVQQAHASPDRTALIFENSSITYGELLARSRSVAARLAHQGVGTGAMVGLHCERSLDMVIAMLGVLQAGAAYLPLDPAAPAARTDQILRDSKTPLVLSSNPARLPSTEATVVELGPLCAATESAPDAVDPPSVDPIDQAAYIIYTSGSTGTPKGVVVEHRNAINFFLAMDEVLEHRPDPEHCPGTWLALTTFAFDISILELLWTLTRGYRVVIQGDSGSYFTSSIAQRPEGTAPMDFGIMYFASSDKQEPGPHKYRLFLEGAKFADEHDFSAVWVPERHFHDFGEIFPNPAVPAAALAVTTSRVQIRSGSVVLPLHQPVRIAEEWAVVDNLSGGRVALSFASGWHADDFVLSPGTYADRKQVLRKGIDQVRELWAGQPARLENGLGETIEVRTRPRPVQPELEVWVTAAGSPSTFELAGELGANVLTHLLGQSLEDVQHKLEVYRNARERGGHDRNGGKVTLMLHTFVGHSMDEARQLVRRPMMDYLGSSLNLLRSIAKTAGIDLSRDTITDADREALLSHAFDRYFETSALFGTVEHCVEMVARVQAIGVTEIASLIDFGLPVDTVLDGLTRLDRVRQICRRSPDEAYGIADQLQRYEVTHAQCTPSLARMLLADPATRDALAPLQRLCVGGEELPLSLAQELGRTVEGSVHNMYGPTETTIWSSTKLVTANDERVTIGRPLVNNSVYILDQHRQLVPPWVPGEIYIGGDGVARGYHQRPELTAQRFVDCALGDEPPQRLYRTGDVGKMRDDEIVFLGRNDSQIKIRGFRIELGEIDAKLAALAGVRQAATVVHMRGDDKVLVGCVVLEADADATSASLRGALAEVLPQYMVPSSIAVLDRFPQTPNGKIDRRALAEQCEQGTGEHRDDVVPHDITQLRLQRIWTEILGTDVGVGDNFFELGGHSLLAVRLLSLVEQEFGRKLPLASLFHSPTITALARAITANTPIEPEIVVKIRDGGGQPPVFLLPGAGGNVLYFYELARSLDIDATIYGMQSLHKGGQIDPQTLVFELAQRYLHDIKRVQPEGPYRLVGHSFGGWVCFEIAQRLVAQGETVSFLGILDSPAPVHIEEPTGHDWDSAKWVHVLAGVVERLYGQPLGLDEDHLRTLSKTEQLACLGDTMRGLGVRPPGLDIEQLEGFYEVFRADQLALYHPTDPYTGTISVFRAVESHPDNARGPEMVPILADRHLGWTDFSSQPIEVFDVPGDHLSMMAGEHAKALAVAITDRIRRDR